MEQSGPPRYRPNNPEPVYVPNQKYLNALRGFRCLLAAVSMGLILSSFTMMLQPMLWDSSFLVFNASLIAAVFSSVAYLSVRSKVRRNVPLLYRENYESHAAFKMFLIATVISVSVFFTIGYTVHLIDAAADKLASEVTAPYVK